MGGGSAEIATLPLHLAKRWDGSLIPPIARSRVSKTAVYVKASEAFRTLKEAGLFKRGISSCPILLKFE